MTQARALPVDWARRLADVIEALRPGAILEAWRLHDRVLNDQPPEVSETQRANAAETTACNAIVDAAYIPFHLIRDHEERKEALDLYETSGRHALARFISERHGHPPTLLVCGDQSVPAVVEEALDEQLAEHPAEIVAVGPGPGLEGIVRDYAAKRGISQFCVRGRDDTNGHVWRNPDGHSLRRALEMLFDAHRPGAVLVLEPAEHPAIAECLDLARERGLSVWTSTQASRALLFDRPGVSRSAARP